MTETVDLITRKQELRDELERLEAAEKQEKAEAIAKLDKDKDGFMHLMAASFGDLHLQLAELKKKCLTDGNKIYDRLYTVEGKEPREVKSFTLKTENDQVKLQIERAERFEFSAKATVHINAIKDIFKEKFAKRNQGLYDILDGLLIKGNKGDYDPKLLAKARQQVKKLGDENLIMEFEKLEDCQRVVGTAQYCRLHQRDATGKWQEVSLQFSSL